MMWSTIIYWRLLRKSGIFNYWYRRFLKELLFDLEIADVPGEKIMMKYQEKLSRI